MVKCGLGGCFLHRLIGRIIKSGNDQRRKLWPLPFRFLGNSPQGDQLDVGIWPINAIEVVNRWGPIGGRAFCVFAVTAFCNKDANIVEGDIVLLAGGGEVFEAADKPACLIIDLVPMVE